MDIIKVIKIMVKVKNNLIGKSFGRLNVIKQVEDYIKPNGKHEAQWLCQCNCAEHNYIIVVGYRLTKKNGTRSCGCLRKEKALNTMYCRSKKYNKYDLSKDYGIGWTSNTNKEFYFDLEDYDNIKDYCWCEHIDGSGYHSLTAWDTKLKKIIKMHYIILHKNCDHNNQNPLDNRKENLRHATLCQNAQNKGLRKNNKTGIIGVKWHKTKKCWEATIQANNNKIYLGSFVDKEEAIKTRLKAEQKYMKEFAPQKHLFDKYNINNESFGD